nr:platelet-aggregating proteinase PA-BJ-like isoform X2 [Dermatophagoides farinae]
MRILMSSCVAFLISAIVLIQISLIDAKLEQQLKDEQIELNRRCRIWNGCNPSPNRWKFMVALFKLAAQSEPGIFKPRIHCTGEILNEYHILTAAHCVYNQSWTDLYVLVGSHSLFGSYHNVDNVHAKYRPTRNGFSPHDMAIIKLNEPVSFDRYVGPVPLPKPFGQHSKFCYTLGYGKERDQSNLYTPIGHRYLIHQLPRLRQVRLPVIDPNICKRISQSKFYRSHQLCAGYIHYRDLSHWLSPKIVSKGDSGGALMCRHKLRNETQSYVLIGLATGGKRPKWFKRADSLFISYYADIKYHLNWIRSHSEIGSISLHNK